MPNTRPPRRENPAQRTARNARQRAHEANLEAAEAAAQANREKVGHYRFEMSELVASYVEAEENKAAAVEKILAHFTIDQLEAVVHDLYNPDPDGGGHGQSQSPRPDDSDLE